MEPLVVAIFGGLIYFSGKHLFSKKTLRPSQQPTEEQPNPFQYHDPSRLHLAFQPELQQGPDEEKQRTIPRGEVKVLNSERKKQKFLQKQRQQAVYLYEGQEGDQDYEHWRDLIKNSEAKDSCMQFRGPEQSEELKKEGEGRGGTNITNKRNKKNDDSGSQQQQGPKTPHNSPRKAGKQHNHNGNISRTAQKLSDTLTEVPITITMMRILAQRPKGEEKKLEWQKSIQMVRKATKRSSSGLSFNQPRQESLVSPIRKISQQFGSQSSAH